MDGRCEVYVEGEEAGQGSRRCFFHGGGGGLAGLFGGEDLIFGFEMAIIRGRSCGS